MKKKNVSIITVVYNAFDTIEQTMQSVINQNYGIENIEYIIIDGCSTDGTDKIIRKYSDKISRVVCEPDQGIYDAMNKGLQIAQGDVIGILNADDYYETETVSEVMNVFNKTETDIVYGVINTIDKEGQKKKASHPPSLDKMWFAMATYHPATFVRKDVYKKIGLFDLNYRITADYEFMLRCYALGVHFTYLDEVLTNFRETGISNTDITSCIKEHIDVALKYVDQSPYPDLVRKELAWKWKAYIWKNDTQNNPEKALQILKACLNVNEINEIIIWGTGVWGENCLNAMHNMNVPIKKILDTNKKVQGSYLHDIEICSPDEVQKDKNTLILIAIKYIDDNLLKKIAEIRLDSKEYVFLTEWMDMLIK